MNRLELLLAIGTFACAVGAMVAGIFGMNLTSYLETQKVTAPALRLWPRAGPQHASLGRPSDDVFAITPARKSLQASVRSKDMPQCQSLPPCHS